MNVLTIGNRPLTVQNCEDVAVFKMECQAGLLESFEGRSTSLEHQPEPIQEWFDLWCGEASVEHNLHADDDRDLLWEKFCEEVAR